MKKEKLIEIGEWAQTRVNSGEEPPWTFYKLKQLAELAFEFADGMDAMIPFTPGMEPEEIRDIQQSSENVVHLELPPRPLVTNLPA